MAYYVEHVFVCSSTVYVSSLFKCHLSVVGAIL